MRFGYRIALFAIGILLSVQGACALSKVVSFNIDTNIARTEEGYARDAFPELRVNARMPKLIRALEYIIEMGAPDIIQLQEARCFTTKFGDKVDSITPLVEFLQRQGYQVSSKRYNPSERAFSYIEAIKSTYTIDEESSRYFTKTPDEPTDHANHAERLSDIKAHNFGEEWERSAYITKFHDANGQTYYAFNVHLGITLEHRLKAAELIKQWAHEYIEREPRSKIIITGDFNTFPDWGGPKQLEILAKDSKLKEATKMLFLHPTMQPINSSFIAFPPDFGANEKDLREEVMQLSTMEPQARRAKILELFATKCKALGGQLDRVYHYGFKSAVARLIPTPQFEGFDSKQFNEEYVKNFIMNHVNEGPAFASDHQPVITVLQ